MKKVLYVALLIVEFFAGAVFMELAHRNTFVIPVIVTAALTLALLVWQIVRLVMAKNDAVKGKIKRDIALVMLLPVAAFVVMLIYIVVGLMMVI